ncbi:hypothetical protein GGR54DRAFT_509014 [Hypoxylon sp. NC1633]|nr:hypothetical protein GGR54DRAFT_509014 [Hypoxylon sp. NC1633]
MTIVKTPIPSWAVTDDDSLGLAVTLLLEDVRQIVSFAKGKQTEGTLTDAELALQLYSEELDSAALFACDRRMSKSIQGAVQTDADALAQSEREERMAQNDHETSASILQGASQTPGTEMVDSQPLDEDLELLEKLSAIYITGVENEDLDGDDVETPLADADGQPESSSWAASRKLHQRRSCTACSEKTRFTDLARAPCRHEYCRDCLTQLFQGAMSDETLFPPRCCKQKIPLERNQLFLPEELVRQFRVKAVELSTPRRTYCHRQTCSAFISPESYDGDVAVCSNCGARTCITCKGSSHPGDCPHDEDLQRVLELAQEKGWQRCPNCLSLISLSQGCFHMTCKCGSQFCYLCSAPWKSCDCRHWDEYRLFDRAEEIYNRDHGTDERLAPDVEHDDNPVETTARQAGIGRIMDNLRVNHECDHSSWRSQGPNLCEECGDWLPVFIYECRQCNIMACRRCRFNRL